jgi:hypothetical protein
MLSSKDLLQKMMESSYSALVSHLDRLELAEALFVPPGGYRSILGTLKHAAGWSHVYHSYAFNPQPASWDRLDWPGGLRETVEKSPAYLQSVIAWLKNSHESWIATLTKVDEEQIDGLRPTHWGEGLPLYEIVTRITGHHLYHAGEINQLLSIYRQEAWEEGEQVEENITPSLGHRVIPPWKLINN